MSIMIRNKFREHMYWCYEKARQILLGRANGGPLPGGTAIDDLTNAIANWTLLEGAERPDWEVDVATRKRALVAGLSDITNQIDDEYPTDQQILAVANARLILFRSRG